MQSLLLQFYAVSQFKLEEKMLILAWLRESWSVLESSQKRLTLVTIALMILMVVVAFTTIGTVFMGLGFGLNPQARVTGIPVWMNSANAFFILSLVLALLYGAIMVALAECMLRFKRQFSIKSPLHEG